MQEKEAKLKRKRRRRKKSSLGYLLLFTFVFITALWGLSYAVKSLSPNVDVEIGNNEALTDAALENDVEIKTVDERLKWIQMEDDLPTVAVRNPEEKKDEKNKEQENNEDKTQQQQKEEPKEEKPVIELPKKIDFDKIENTNPIEQPKQELDFRLPTGNIIEPREPIAKTVTKVYLGAFNSIEEAIKIQQKVASEEENMVPFIKSINGLYMVQIGSFSDQTKAIALASKMREKGYPSKTVTE